MSALESLGRGAGKALRGLGIGLLVLGVVAVGAPWVSGATLVVLVGLLLLAGGGILTLFGLNMRSAGKGNAGLIAGVLTALSGLVLVFQPSLGLATVRWILIVYFFGSGVSEVSLALRVETEEGRAWAVVAGIWTLVLGVVTLTGWPVSGARAIGLLVGFKLAASGLTLIRLHGRLRSVGEKVAAVRARA